MCNWSFTFEQTKPNIIVVSVITPLLCVNAMLLISKLAVAIGPVVIAICDICSCRRAHQIVYSNLAQVRVG